MGQNEKTEKWMQYAMILQSKIGEIFEEEEITMEELNDGDNLTDFIHALANVVPTKFHNSVTGNEVKYLDFNHLANRLVMQYSTRSN